MTWIRVVCGWRWWLSASEPTKELCHVRRDGSHWGAEDQKLHAAYESAADRRVDYKTRTSSLFHPYLKAVKVAGDTPEEATETLARFTEDGGGTTQRPHWMYSQLVSLAKAKRLGTPENWSPAFRDRTGVNVNYSVNAVWKLLALLGV